MNSVGAPQQSKRAPEKGVFPLDHYGECKPVMKVRDLCLCMAVALLRSSRYEDSAIIDTMTHLQEFLTCMKEHQGQHIECKALSKKYLECRMNKYVNAMDMMTDSSVNGGVNCLSTEVSCRRKSWNDWASMRKA